MTLKRRFASQFCAVILVCTLSLFGAVHTQFIDTSADVYVRPAVIIDAGHGGFDGGAVANDGTIEKDINLSIALKLCEMLKFNGYEVIMTRTEDTSTEDKEGSIRSKKVSDLKNRLKLMSENPDAVFVSIHLNKFTTSAASGAQVFYSPNFEEAKLLGECIQKSVVNLIQPDNTRVIKKGTSAAYLLHNAKVPAVIVECGFLSSPKELQKLKDNEYQTRMAFAIMGGILDFFSEKDD